MDNSITSEELKKRIDRGDVDFLFDLRNPEEFAAWRIEGRSEIPTVNIPQISFVGEEEKFLDIFPKNRQIVTVCAHGDSSRYTAELLREHGMDAISLAGGMDSWSDFYETRLVGSSPAIYQIYRVARGCISHVLISENEAVVIDPVRHVDHIFAVADEAGAKITHVIDTHLQADHISGGMEIASKTGADYHINPNDAGPAAFSYAPLKNGELIKFGKSKMEVISSPGHTPGSTSFLLDNNTLFTGDMVMKTSIGRPDLGGKAGEWSKLLYDTLFSAYGRFGDGLRVLPSHAVSIREQDKNGVVDTTIGEARAKLDLFQKHDFTSFLTLVEASLPESPERYQEIRKVNLGLEDPDEKKRKELEIGKNLCGMAHN